MQESILQRKVLQAGVSVPSAPSASHSLSGHDSATIVRTDASLEQLAGEWRELFKRSGCRNAFLSFEWLGAWWRHWGRRHRLWIVTVRTRSGRLVAVAPFYVRRSLLGGWAPSALCFLGTPGVGSDHMNVLVEPEYAEFSVDAIVQLVVAQRAEWDYIELADSEESSPTMTRFFQGLQDFGMSPEVTRTIDCPYTELPATFERYLEGVGANLRYNFRRRWRALEREGNAEFLTLAGGPELHERFGELVQLHRLRFGNQRKHSSFLALDVQAFHADALTRLAAEDLARLFVLQVGGRTVAALYGFSSGKTFSFFQSGMDPAWAKLSVGLVLMGCSIREAIRSGHDHFDFLRGDEAYKFQWATQTRRVATICVFDRRLRSRVFARFYAWSFDQMKQFARKYVLPLLGRLTTQRQATEHDTATK